MARQALSSASGRAPAWEQGIGQGGKRHALKEGKGALIASLMRIKRA
jgi:hypothetical protein